MAPFDLPSFEAEWWPIQWEPIPGSGERLTVAVVTQAADGSRAVRQVIQPGTLRTLFEGSAAQFLISKAVASLDRQLKTGAEIRRLLMPFEGLEVGPPRDCRAADLEEVVEQAIALSASLGVTTFGVHESSDLDWQQAYRAWARQIESEAEHAGLPWKGRFNPSIKTSTGRSKTAVNYLHDGYAANFGVIRPKPAYDKRSLKVKLYDLRAFRRDSPIAVSRCELLIGVPPRNMPGMTARDAKAVNECLEWVTHEGKQEGVQVYQFVDAQAVLAHLQKAA